MAEIEDGGPAFPHLTRTIPGTNITERILDQGMSLRDWFAGQALVGLMASDSWTTAKDYPDMAYRMADAMIAARRA